MTSRLTVLDGWIEKPVAPVWASSVAPDNESPLGWVQELSISGLLEQYSKTIEPRLAAVPKTNEKSCGVVALATELPIETFLVTSSAAPDCP